MRQFEVLYALKGEAFWLVEIKRLDLPSDAPKSARFAWLKIDGDRISRLTFQSMDDQGRTFAEGRLDLHGTDGCFEGVDLETGPLPSEILPLISDWILA